MVRWRTPKRLQVHFYQCQAGHWFWEVLHPDLTVSTSPEFQFLHDAISDAQEKYEHADFSYLSTSVEFTCRRTD